jgi:hypothetical protein
VDREIDHTPCRRTQFVGGDTARACVPLIRRLREENKGTLLVYSVEVDENEAAGGTRTPDKGVHRRIVQEMIRSIDIAAEFEDSQAREAPGSGRRTWVAIKVVSLIDDYLKRRKLLSKLGRAHSYPMRPRWYIWPHTFPPFARATLYYTPVARAQMTSRFSS